MSVSLFLIPELASRVEIGIDWLSKEIRDVCSQNNPPIQCTKLLESYKIKKNGT